jgi:hypothetical protein
MAETAMEIIDELKEKTEQEVEETPAADFFMGIVLMVLSGIVFLMALSIFVHSFKRKGYRLFVEFFSVKYFRESWIHGNLRLCLFASMTVLVYAIVILNLLPFEIGTVIFMSGTLYLYWRAKIYKILIISACVVAFYSLSFKVLFKLVLPGVGM